MKNVILTILHEFKYILEIMIVELYILQCLSPARICVALHQKIYPNKYVCSMLAYEDLHQCMQCALKRINQKFKIENCKKSKTTKCMASSKVVRSFYLLNHFKSRSKMQVDFSLKFGMHDPVTLICIYLFCELRFLPT